MMTSEIHHTVPPQAVPILLKAKELILQEPRRFVMETWGEKSPYPDAEKIFLRAGSYPNPPCGTVGCLAGWALIGIKPEIMEKDGWDFERALGSASGEVRDAAHLTFDQGQKLFRLTRYSKHAPSYPDKQYGYYWPPAFEQAYLNAETPAARAQVGADRIDHFLRTGE